jgi:transposase
VSPRIKRIWLERKQTRWTVFDLDSLIDEKHTARTIWELSGRLDLTRFEEEQKTREGEAGRPCWPARLLVSVWVYSYSLGIASARAIERMLSHEPGLRWLCADEQINHHTLSDFRVGHKEALQDLFAQFLLLLDAAGLVDLNTLLHDGTKVRAVAGRGSFHRRGTLEKRVRQARRVVRQLQERAEAESETADERHRAAQKRAAQEALQRAEAALQKLKKLEAETTPAARAELRVSHSEPEARKMKHPDGGWAPSYNVQVTTEAQARVIVGIGVTDAANDTQQLLPALDIVKSNCGALPATIIADNGYATRSNVEQTSDLKVELMAPWKDDLSREAGACKRNGIQSGFEPSAFRMQRGGKKLTCPAGKMLLVIQQKTHHGIRRNVFEARAADCSACRYRQACCGNRSGPRRVEKVVESRAMKQYLARMKRPQVRQLYRRRSEIAEFPHLWAKAIRKWQRFSVRGLVKAGIEALWVALAYNVAQWLRLDAAHRPAAA